MAAVRSYGVSSKGHGHAGAVANVVAYQVSNDTRISRVVLRDAGFNLAKLNQYLHQPLWQKCRRPV